MTRIKFSHALVLLNRQSKQIQHVAVVKVFLGPLSGMLLEEIRSNTMLEATACTLLSSCSDRMSWTLTSQTMLSNTKTNVLSSFKSYTARSKKCLLISSWTVYFIDFKRHTPYTVLVQPVNKLERNSKEQITGQRG